jgi:hypothetical protein
MSPLVKFPTTGFISNVITNMFGVVMVIIISPPGEAMVLLLLPAVPAVVALPMGTVGLEVVVEASTSPPLFLPVIVMIVVTVVTVVIVVVVVVVTPCTHSSGLGARFSAFPFEFQWLKHFLASSVVVQVTPLQNAFFKSTCALQYAR